jgi:hypothetical protein
MFKIILSRLKSEKHFTLASKFVTKPSKAKIIDPGVKPALFWFVITLTNSSRSFQLAYKVRGNERRKIGKREREKERR